MLSFLVVSTLILNVAAQSTACPDWLARVHQRREQNPAISYYNGNITGADVEYVCQSNRALGVIECCDDQSSGGSEFTHAERFQLSAWTWTCSTFEVGGEDRAALCWNSHFTESCEDYDLILESECGLGAGKGPGGEGVSAIASQLSTRTPIADTTTSTSSPASTATSSTSNIPASTTSSSATPSKNTKTPVQSAPVASATTESISTSASKSGTVEEPGPVTTKAVATGTRLSGSSASGGASLGGINTSDTLRPSAASTNGTITGATPPLFTGDARIVRGTTLLSIPLMVMMKMMA